MLKNIIITIVFTILFFTGCTNKNVAIVGENGKYGTFEDSGEVAVKPIYDNISSFDDLEDKNARVQHPHYFNIHWLHNNEGKEYAIVKYEGKYGIISRDNKMLVKPIYDSISKFFNGFALIKVDNKYGFLDKEFNVVQKPIFKDAREFLADVTFVQSTADGKWGCITKDMDLKINAKYDEIYNLYNGFARVKNGDKWGFINDKCEVVVEPKYEYVYDFSKGYAKVVKNNLIGYINSEGKEVSEKIFNLAQEF